MRYSILLLVALGLAALMPSCVKEKLTAGDGTSTFRISTRALNESPTADPDYLISTLRVIAFDKASGNVRSNKLYSDAELTGNPITHTMYTGTYDFVFVGNEPADLTAALNGVVRASELSGAGFSISASAFGSALSIPMVLRVDNVTVLADDAGVSVGGATQSTWAVALERIGILIEDIVLTSKSNLTGATITSVKFTNIPNSVPMMTGGSYPGSLTFGASPTFSSFPAGVAVSDADKGLYGIPIANSAMKFAPPRIILPHNEFTPLGDAGRALSMELVTSKGTFNYKVGLAPETDYTLTRNCKYRLICTTDPSGLEVHIQAAGWTDEAAGGDPLNRILNVSAVRASITDVIPARIYFWSNQSDVFVEDRGNYGASGTEAFTVNTVFADLSGGSSTNFHCDYSSGNGVGYIELTLVAGLTYEKSGTYRIYLNAGGLKREITAIVNLLEAFLTVDPSSLNFSSNADNTGKTVTVESNMTWEVSSNQPWCTVTSASGTKNGSFNVKVEANTGARREAEITVTGTVGGTATGVTRTVSVTQDPPGGSADRITWGYIEELGKYGYVIANDPRDAGLYFKYGSVIGVYSASGGNQVLPGANTEYFNAANDIPFNFSDIEITGTYNAGWSKVPNVSSQTNIYAALHTAANVKAGCGDPCRLVGLDLKKIQDKDASSLTPADIDNGIWRLPTLAENKDFSGQQSNNSYYSSHWWDGTGGTYPSPFSSVIGGEFPQRNNGYVSKFLPAAGHRNGANGTVGSQGVEGFYWSSEWSPVNNNSYSYYLNFDKGSIQPVGSTSRNDGHSVRCVRQ